MNISCSMFFNCFSILEKCKEVVSIANRRKFRKINFAVFYYLLFSKQNFLELFMKFAFLQDVSLLHKKIEKCSSRRKWTRIWKNSYFAVVHRQTVKTIFYKTREFGVSVLAGVIFCSMIAFYLYGDKGL